MSLPLDWTLAGHPWGLRVVSLVCRPTELRLLGRLTERVRAEPKQVPGGSGHDDLVQVDPSHTRSPDFPVHQLLDNPGSRSGALLFHDASASPQFQPEPDKPGAKCHPRGTTKGSRRQKWSPGQRPVPVSPKARAIPILAVELFRAGEVAGFGDRYAH